MNTVSVIYEPFEESPRGIPVAHSTYHKPLYKMAKKLMQPKVRNIVKIGRRKVRKRHKAFY